MSRNLDDVLNDCLERIAEGEDVRECASRYPEHAEELFPLLSIASVTMQAASLAKYSPQSRAHNLQRLTRLLADRRASGRRRTQFFVWRPLASPLILALAAVFVVVVAAGGTAVASSDSVPGNPLYWVKTTRENISLRMIPRSDAGTAQVHADLANVRGRELRRVIARGRFQDVDRLMKRINYHLNKSAAFAGVLLAANPVEMPVRPRRLRANPNIARLRASLEKNGNTLNVELERLMLDVPPGHKNRVRQLMRESELGYRILIQAMQSGTPPGSLPFWKVEPPAPGSQ